MVLSAVDLFAAVALFLTIIDNNLVLQSVSYGDKNVTANDKNLYNFGERKFKQQKKEGEVR